MQSAKLAFLTNYTPSCADSRNSFLEKGGIWGLQHWKYVADPIEVEFRDTLSFQTRKLVRKHSFLTYFPQNRKHQHQQPRSHQRLSLERKGLHMRRTCHQ